MSAGGLRKKVMDAIGLFLGLSVGRSIGWCFESCN